MRPRRGYFVVERIRYRTVPLSWIVGVGLPLLTFGGGVLLKVWSVADSIATKAELAAVRETTKAELQILRDETVANFRRTDEAIAKSVDASKKYSDDKYVQTKEEYHQYSDGNKLKSDNQYAELKGQTTLILSILQELKFNTTTKRSR